jgi:multicomponent Na+:H+ antiporter subunit D
VAVGVVTALLGAAMCFLQEHIKRLLAFSTISHVGIFICGIALLSHKALAGVAVYVAGHGLTKAALFMCAGVLLHRFATIDEFDLHGRGRELPIVGVLMAIGALLLAAIPPFTTFMGKSLLEAGSSAAHGYGWLIAVYIAASAITGGAVLRVTARVFLGWGPSEPTNRSQAEAAHENVDEERDAREHTPPLMVLMPAVLLGAVLVLGLIPGAVPGVERLAAQFVEHRNYAAWVLHSAHVVLPVPRPSHVSGDDYGYAAIGVLGALALAVAGLFGRYVRASLPDSMPRGVGVVIGAVRGLHSGHIADYIAWWTAGAGALGGVCLIALR